MTLQTDLETAVADAQAASQKLKDVVNGPSTGAGSTVAVDSGPVKTVARAIAEVGDTSNQALKDLSNVVDGDFTAKAVAAGVAGDVIAAGNLADLTDAAAARSNLGLGAAAIEMVSVGGAGGLLRADGDGSGLTGIVTGANAAEKANIMLNAFRISVNGGLSIQQMADGVVDEYEDETGVSPSYVQIPQSDGTPIGNMTAGGGLAAGFDGNTAQGRASGALTPGGAPASLSTFIGKDWGSGNDKTIARFVVYSPNDGGIQDSNAGNGNLELQGSTDNFATSVVTLYSGPFLGGVEVVDVDSGITTTTAYRYHRIATTGNTTYTNGIAEVRFFTAGESVDETYDAASDCFTNRLLAPGLNINDQWVSNYISWNYGLGGPDTNVDFENLPSGNTSTPYYAEMQFASAREILGASVWASVPYLGLRAGTWEYSDDGSSWTVAASFSETPTYGGEVYSSWTSVGSHAHWRLNMTGYSGSPVVTSYRVRFYERSVRDMTLVSTTQAALAVPTDCLVTVWQEDVDSVTPNTDLTVEVGRDGGVTWTPVTLAEQAALDTGRVLTGAADISGQPSGTSMRYRIETLNTKEQRIHGVALQWS